MTICAYFTLHVYTESNQQAKPKFRYHRGDYIRMNSELMKVNWPIIDYMNVEEAWSFFSEKFGAAMNAHIPKTIPAKDCR